MLTGAAVGLIAVMLSYFNLFGNLERSALDLRFNLRGVEEPADEICVVGITESCLAELGRWPWNRDIHAGLLDIFSEGVAGVIVMDIILAEPSQQVWMDEALIEATKKAPTVIYPIDAPPIPSLVAGLLSPSRLILPIPGLYENARAGFINVTPDRDGILRRAIMLMENQGEPLYPLALLARVAYNDQEKDLLEREFKEIVFGGRSNLTIGNHQYQLDGGGRTLINFSGGPGNFPVLPYHLVLAGAYPASTFRNKVVMVGFYASGLGDYYFTPFSRDLPMYGVEVHANILHMLLRAGPINSLPLWLNLLLVFTLGLLSLLFYRIMHPLWGLGALLLFCAAYVLITMYFFIENALYIEMTYPLLALTGSYVTSLGYRFVMEQQDRQRVTRVFGRYVAPQVVDEILSVGEENLRLGGTRRKITALFIDIRGFTPLSEKLSPEEVVEILNQYFEIVTRCIFENKGTIDKFMGDAAMALFNAPLRLEDHCLWALRAARAILVEGATLQRKIKDMSSVDLNFGIGINTGDAVVGNIGSLNRMEYTAIGDAVNLAARLEANAKPGQVLVSKSVYDEIGRRMPLEPVGEIMVKGKSKPVMVYQLKLNNGA